MKYYVFLFITLSITLNIFSSYNKPIRSQENLKQILLNEPIKSIKLSKELINSIYYYSIKKKNKLETLF